MKKLSFACAFLVVLPATSLAENIAISGKIGLTTGYGIEATLGNDNFSGRVGANKYNINENGNANNMNFDFKLQLQSVSALADWYPFSGRFRVSGGLYSNKSKIEMTAVPDAGSTYTINGVTYAADTAVSSLQGRLTFSPMSPYLGIGWGNPVANGKGWGMVSDIGVIFQGAPKYSLSATCGAALTAPECTQMQSDVAAEQASQQNDLNNSFRYWPVLSIGVSYQW